MRNRRLTSGAAAIAALAVIATAFHRCSREQELLPHENHVSQHVERMKELFGPEAGTFSLPDLRLRQHADGAEVRGNGDNAQVRSDGDGDNVGDTQARDDGNGDNADGLASPTRSTGAPTTGLEDAMEPDWTKAAVWQNDRSVITEVPAVLKKPVD